VIKQGLRPRRLATFDTVIKTLGGPTAVGDLVGKSSSYVCNWRRFSGKIPPKYYLIISEALADQGFVAADHLFGFAKPPRKRKPRSTYCELAVSNVVWMDFRKRKVRLAA
jgi:hypothetical protein